MSLAAFQTYKPRAGRCGVYILLNSTQRAVYVGQTTDIDRRIVHHRSRKNFKSAVWLEVAEEDLLDYEGALIRALNPRGNSRAYGRLTRDAEILASLGLEPDPDRAFETRVDKSNKEWGRKMGTWFQRLNAARRERSARIAAFVEAA